MDAGIVGAGRRIVGFERRVQAERAGPDVADIEAGLGDQQLPVIVDDAERARHFRQVVDDDRAVGHRLFEQFPAAMSNQNSLPDCGS